MRADMAEVKQVLGAIYLQLQGKHAQGVDGSTLETLTAFKAAAKCAQEVIVVDEATNSIQDGAAMVSTDVIESVEVGSSGEDKTAVRRATDEGGKEESEDTEDEAAVRCATEVATDDRVVLASMLRSMRHAVQLVQSMQRQQRGVQVRRQPPTKLQQEWSGML